MGASRPTRERKIVSKSLSPAKLRKWAQRFARAGLPELARSGLLLNAVNPWSLRAGWEIVAADLAAAGRRLGDDAAAAPLVLRMYNLSGLGREASAPRLFDTVVAGRRGQRYIEFRDSGAVCAAELGLLRPDGALERLAWAGPLALPSNGARHPAPPPRGLARWMDGLRKGRADDDHWRIVRLDSAPPHATAIVPGHEPAAPSDDRFAPRVVAASAALRTGAAAGTAGSGGGSR